MIIYDNLRGTVSETIIRLQKVNIRDVKSVNFGTYKININA